MRQIPFPSTWILPTRGKHTACRPPPYSHRGARRGGAEDVHTGQPGPPSASKTSRHSRRNPSASWPLTEEGEGPAAAGRVAEGRADSRSRPVPRSPQAPTWQGTAPSAPQRPRAPSGKGAERASRTGLWLPRGGAGAPGNIPDCAVVMAAPLKKFTRTNWTALGESSSSKAVAQRSNDRSVLATAETITTKGDEGTFGVHLNWGSVYRGAQSLKQNGALNWTRPGRWHHRQAAPMRLVKTPRSCPRA